LHTGDELSRADQGAYLKSLEDKAISRGIVETARDEGIEKGEQIGAEKTTRQGIIRALQGDKLTVTEIADLFAVSLETVLTIQQDMTNS
jgi:predicted transposase YdaD